MRTLALITCLIFLSNLEVKSQEYVPFPTDSATWKEASELMGKGFNAWIDVDYEMSGDTIVSGLSYQKIYINIDNTNTESEPYYIGGLREDDDKKIYFRPDSLVVGGSFVETEPLSFPSDTTEYLIYNFSQLEIGDTLFYNNSLNPDYINVVLNTDSIMVGESYRKVYEVSESFGWLESSVFIIEGIGGSKGLLTPFKSPLVGSIMRYQLSCFTHSDLSFENPYEEEVINCQVGLSVPELSSSHLTLHPNPISDYVFIESSRSAIQSILIHSQTGKLVYSDTEVNRKKLELDLSHLEVGMYFIQILDAQGPYSEKVVKN